MNLKQKLAALAMTGVVTLSGCAAVSGTAASDTTASEAAPTTSESTSSETTEAVAPDSRTGPAGGMRGGPGGGVDASGVTTEAGLVELIQEAYGDAGLDLHRGHQPVQDVLDEVLTISHDELHVRMEAGQNLSDVAEDLGVGTQTLIDALVESRAPAIDSLLAAGTITQEEADAYRVALEEAFTFRVTWDGQAATPAFEGLS